jgi:hypothetical protein
MEPVCKLETDQTNKTLGDSSSSCQVPIRCKDGNLRGTPRPVAASYRGRLWAHSHTQRGRAAASTSGLDFTVDKGERIVVSIKTLFALMNSAEIKGDEKLKLLLHRVR